MIRAALLCLALVAVATLPGTPWSGADFTAGTASPSNTFAAATDFNTVAVTMTDPGTPLKGTVALQATASTERGVASVRYESSPAGANTWTTACQGTSAPYGCDWNTTAVADGLRDLRAVATDAAGYQRTSAVIASRRVDNTAPTVALADPGAYLSGTATLSATGFDAGSGLSTLAIEHRAPGGSWATLCTGATSPRSCSLATAALPDGPRELRAVATDAAGNQGTSALTRPVDNTAPAVSLPALGPVRGTIDIPVTASDAGTGVASVTVQILVGGTWTDACTDAAAPWQCTGLDSTDIADGVYQARAVAVDGAGRTTTSSPISVRVDNTAPAGVSVAAANGGTAGRLEAGDSLTLTYSEQIAPASVLSGWTGGSQAIRVTIADFGNSDRMDFTTTGGTRLNLVLSATDLTLGANFVNAATVFNATMTQSGAAITVTLGSRISGTVTTASPGTMTWKPSNLATDLAGNAALSTQVTETGAADRDF